MSKTLKKEYKANSKKSLCKSKKEKKCKKIKGCKMSKGPKKTFCRKIKNKKYRKTVKKGGEIKRKTIEEDSEENLKNSFLIQNRDGDILEIDMLTDAQNGEKYYLLKENNGNKELILLDAELVNYAKENNELNELVKQYNGGKILMKKTKGGFTVGDAVNMASNSPMGAKLKDELKAKAEKMAKAKIPLDENKLHMIHMILSKLDDEKIKALMNGVKSIDQETMNKILKGDKMAIAKVIKENPKLTAEIMKETMHKGGNLDELLNSFTKNNTNRSFEDIARETKEHEKKAEEYRYKANQLAHESANRYQTMDNVQSRRPFSNGGNQHLPEPNNNPAKLYKEITERPMTNKTAIIEKVKNEGLVNGDILVYDSDSYGLLTEDDIIFVGIDSNTFYDFEFVKEATKYTTNFFSKYKELLKDSKRNSGVYDLRHDDEFITKQFDETKPEYMYKVDIDADDDENESITIISEYCLEPYERLRKKEIEGDLRTILKSV
tara:strand:- start:11698 stop:13176 length:1479 start_codon:yes stop_codon:yes gene_type:complete